MKEHLKEVNNNLIMDCVALSAKRSNSRFKMCKDNSAMIFVDGCWVNVSTSLVKSDPTVGEILNKSDSDIVLFWNWVNKMILLESTSELGERVKDGEMFKKILMESKRILIERGNMFFRMDSNNQIFKFGE